MKLEELYKMIGQALEARLVVEEYSPLLLLNYEDYKVRLRTRQDGQVMESAIDDVEVDHEQRVVYINEAGPVVPVGCWPKEDRE